MIDDRGPSACIDGLDDVTRAAWEVTSLGRPSSYTPCSALRTLTLSRICSLPIAFQLVAATLYPILITTTITMVRELTKIVYKPSVEVNEEFIVIVNPQEVGFS